MTDIRVPQTGNTFYGDKIISFKDMLSEEETEQAIRAGLTSIFGRLGLSHELLLDTLNYCIDSAKKYSNLLKYERTVRNFLQQNGVLEKYYALKKNRAELRSEKVKKHLLGETILDLGCGAGKFGKIFSRDGYEVTLADVYKNSNIDSLNLPFFLINDGEPLPFDDNSFDNVLVLSMLHHTQNPFHTMEECKRVLKKGGRLHLIETVYGISPETSKGSYANDDLSFRSLSNEQQRQVTMFFDYFLNHILDAYTENPEKYVPVPFNFTTPDNLQQTFREKGFELLSRENLGIYPFSYVYHIHFVYSKK